MDNKTRKFFITGIIVVIAIISLIFFSFNLSGMFLLSTNLDGDLNNVTIQEIDYKMTSVDLQSLNLTYKIIEKTILQTNIDNLIIKNCPNESEINFKIKNVGRFDLIRTKIIFPRGVNIFSCNNCSIENLKIGEEVEVGARICSYDNMNNEIKIVSSNADDLFIILN